MKNRLLFCCLLLLLMSSLIRANQQRQHSADVVQPTVILSTEAEHPELKVMR